MKMGKTRTLQELNPNQMTAALQEWQIDALCSQPNDTFFLVSQKHGLVQFATPCGEEELQR